MTLVLPAVNPQEVTITNLNNNPGLLPHKLGAARVKSKIHSFIHYFDLDPIQKEIKSLKDINKNLTLALTLGLSHPYFVELDNFIRAISYQINAAEQKFNSLSPSNRVKRGLIDALGSIIKAISGNLDAEDAIHYDKAISELEINQKEIVQTVNKQISLTSEILENYNQTITLIKSNQDVITSGLNKIQSEFNKFIFEFNDYLETRNVLDQLNLSLNIILQLLADLENAITFARLGTFHSSILKTNELKSIIESIVKYYGNDNLLFPNYDSNLHRYYDLLEIEAYYSGSKIVFVIHFPVVYPETFTYYHLYSIPTQNSSTIVPKNSFLIMNENFYQYTSLPCVNLHPNYYCPDGNLVDGLQEEDCVFQLLQLRSTPTNCYSIPVRVNKEIFQQIDEAYYIAILPNQTKIETSCSRTDLTMLQGNYLIHLPYNCRFGTQNQFFINEKIISNGQPMLLPQIHLPEAHHIKNFSKIQIQDIPLDKIHEIQKKQAILQQVQLQSSNQWTFNYWQIPIWLIIIAISTWYITKFIQKRRIQSNQNTAPTEATQGPSNTPKPFFNP